MSKYVTIRVERRSDFDCDKMLLKRLGEDTYRLTTCDPDKHDFSNRMRAERFDDDFVSQYNKFVKQKEDEFDLRGRDAYRILTDLRNRLERGDSSIRLKVQD